MSRFYFIANNLALDLANTLAADEGRPIDLISSFDDLIDWALEAGIINQRQAADALKNTDEPLSSRVLKKTTDLRDALKATAAALAIGKAVPKSAIDRINAVLSEKEGHFEIARTAGEYKSRLNIGYDDIRDLMLPVAESAMRLICYGDPSLVKKCANSECVLYFYDTSKRHGRKWCSMSACGNRAKAAAFYERSRISQDN
jgi:predicted RNA-binding Zn ribbon-like protein